MLCFKRERDLNRLRRFQPMPAKTLLPMPTAALPRGESHLLLGNERAELAARIFADGWRAGLLTLGGIALVGFFGYLDYLTGPELSFAIFYLVPIDRKSVV